MNTQIFFSLILATTALGFPHHEESHQESRHHEQELPNNVVKDTHVDVGSPILVPYPLTYPHGVPGHQFIPVFMSPQQQYHPEMRNVNLGGGFNLGPIGAGFGAGVTPGQIYVGLGGGYSGNLFTPYNYQQPNQLGYTNVQPIPVSAPHYG